VRNWQARKRQQKRRERPRVRAAEASAAKAKRQRRKQEKSVPLESPTAIVPTVSTDAPRGAIAIQGTSFRMKGGNADA